MIIKEITFDSIKEAAAVIRNSFITAAEEFGITKENAPTNAAFITSDLLISSIEKGLKLYGLFLDDKIIGCVGIEDAKKNGIFYIEKLSVLPEYRHNGYGKNLLDYAVNEIKNANGRKVSIGIIDKNVILKNWYFKYGFVEKEVKTFKHLPFDVCFMEIKYSDMQGISKELIETAGVFFDKYYDLNEKITSIKLSNDKWSLKEIIGHLIDSASNNHQRFVRLQIESKLVFPAYHYNWIDIEKYNLMKYSDIIILWKHFNILLADIIKSIDDKSLTNIWIKDGNNISLQDIVIDYLRHLKEHLQHFEERYNEIKNNI